MKTAISIPDQVFESAERLAQQLGKSRSQLYTQALESYLDVQSRADVTQRLDEVYSESDSALDPVLRGMQAQSIARDEW